MSLKSLEEVHTGQKPDIDAWLIDALEAKENQISSYYGHYLEQMAMQNAFKNIALGNDLNGRFLPNSAHGTRYGRKVFLGGLPVGISSDEILANFNHFGPARIDWPHKAFHEYIPPAGYAFIIFQNGVSVNHLIEASTYMDYKYGFAIRTHNGEKRMIEVKPWDMKNNELVLLQDWKQYERYSVFVGGLPRTITARELTDSVQDAVGGVAYVGIEIDSNEEYPKGAARIVFNNQESYVRAIAMNELTVLSAGNERIAEIKPYLHPKMVCETCNGHLATSFCPQIRCLKYFCDFCWKIKHSIPGLTTHKRMQKGRYYLSSNVHNGKAARHNFSHSHSVWPMSSTRSNSLESFSMSGQLFNSFGGVDPRLRYLNSYGPNLGSMSPEISPFTPFSDESIFKFKS